MNFVKISRSSKESIYNQIYLQIKKQIVNTSLKPGDQLPSIRKLANELKVSVITTKKAYEELEKDGVVESRRGAGYFVKEINFKEMKEKNTRIIEERISSSINDLLEYGYEPEEIRDVFDNQLREVLGKK